MSGESSSHWKFSRFCQHYVIPSRLLGERKKLKMPGSWVTTGLSRKSLGFLFFLPLENNEAREGFSQAVFACRAGEKSYSLWGQREPPERWAFITPGSQMRKLRPGTLRDLPRDTSSCLMQGPELPHACGVTSGRSLCSSVQGDTGSPPLPAELPCEGRTR